MITRTFKLCLNAGTGSAPFINVSQTDMDEVWLFELYTETGERYIPSSGAIIGIKSDGHGIANTGTVDSEGRVVITETEQMTASAGRAIFELSIDGLTHGTANFIVNVEKKPIDGAIMSDSDLSLISQAVDAAATIEDLIDGHDPDEVIADAVDAWLDDHPEATTTVQDGAITEAKLNDEVKTGVFEDMTVGTSLAVMNDEGVTDNLAYKFRQTGGDAVRELDEIVGGTIAWNQQIGLDHLPSDSALYSATTYTANGVTFTKNDDGSISVVTDAGGATANTSVKLGKQSTLPMVNSHIHLIRNTGGSASTAFVNYATSRNTYTENIWQPYSGGFNMWLRVDQGSVFTTPVKVYPQIFDLTQMFGSTVADAIYAMEQSSAGSGVAYFRSLFPNAYYAYNSGELVSVEGLSAHVTNSANLFDETTAVKYSRFISSTNKWVVSDGSNMCVCYYCKPNTTYTVSYGDPSVTDFRTGVINVDPATAPANATLTQVNKTLSAHTFTTDSDAVAIVIQINRGTYEAGTSKLQVQIGDTATAFKKYAQHTYQLDSTLTLRGVPKWNNGLYFDGDIYRHDGSVSRRYGIVDLGTLTWATRYTGSNNKTLSSALPQRYVGYPEASMIAEKYTVGSTNAAASLAPPDEHDIGIYTYRNAASPVITTIYMVIGKDDTPSGQLVYEVAEPTTEQADPYQQYQICDGKGTEEYVSTTVTPVGHSTFYPVDIVSKVNKLPSDFSTLIAPTEATFKATRNYTVNDLLIVNNVLYKVTANIASGGTITVNTNVQQTTLGALIKALS